MPSTYAVAWSGGDTRFVGHARLQTQALRLEGRNADGGEGLRTIVYDDIEAIGVSRTNGSRGIVLDVAGDERIVITSLDRPGSLGELIERLRSLTDSPQD